MSEKIFGIGYPKTATSSLALALEILDYRGFHDAVELVEAYRNKNLKNSEFLKKGDAFIGSIAFFYRELYELYPDAKFILTVREENKWLDSARRHFKFVVPWKRTNKYIMTRIFSDLTHFSEEIFLKCYKEHNRKIKEFFRNKGNLLIMDICNGDGWEKLCPFLGKAVPDIDFPKVNYYHLEARSPGRRILRRFKNVVMGRGDIVKYQ